jgi:hypothetical protein
VLARWRPFSITLTALAVVAFCTPFLAQLWPAHKWQIALGMGPIAASLGTAAFLAHQGWPARRILAFFFQEPARSLSTSRTVQSIRWEKKMDSQISPLTLPSGGTVEFVDLDDLTGADVHALRRTIAAADTGGETTNKLFVASMAMAIKTWDVPYLDDPRTPQANPQAWKKLRARDLNAIESALQPVLELLQPPPVASIDNTEPGSPTRPDSE